MAEPCRRIPDGLESNCDPVDPQSTCDLLDSNAVYFFNPSSAPTLAQVVYKDNDGQCSLYDIKNLIKLRPVIDEGEAARESVIKLYDMSISKYSVSLPTWWHDAIVYTTSSQEVSIYLDVRASFVVDPPIPDVESINLLTGDQQDFRFSIQLKRYIQLASYDMNVNYQLRFVNGSTNAAVSFPFHHEFRAVPSRNECVRGRTTYFTDVGPAPTQNCGDIGYCHFTAFIDPACCDATWKNSNDHFTNAALGDLCTLKYHRIDDDSGRTQSFAFASRACEDRDCYTRAECFQTLTAECFETFVFGPPDDEPLPDTIRESDESFPAESKDVIQNPTTNRYLYAKKLYFDNLNENKLHTIEECVESPASVNLDALDIDDMKYAYIAAQCLGQLNLIKNCVTDGAFTYYFNDDGDNCCETTYGADGSTKPFSEHPDVVSGSWTNVSNLNACTIAKTCSDPDTFDAATCCDSTDPVLGVYPENDLLSARCRLHYCTQDDNIDTPACCGTGGALLSGETPEMNSLCACYNNPSVGCCHDNYQKAHEEFQFEKFHSKCVPYIADECIDTPSQECCDAHEDAGIAYISSESGYDEVTDYDHNNSNSLATACSCFYFDTFTEDACCANPSGTVDTRCQQYSTCLDDLEQCCSAREGSSDDMYTNPAIDDKCDSYDACVDDGAECCLDEDRSDLRPGHCESFNACMTAQTPECCGNFERYFTDIPSTSDFQHELNELAQQCSPMLVPQCRANPTQTCCNGICPIEIGGDTTFCDPWLASVCEWVDDINTKCNSPTTVSNTIDINAYFTTQTDALYCTLSIGGICDEECKAACVRCPPGDAACIATRTRVDWDQVNPAANGTQIRRCCDVDITDRMDSEYHNQCIEYLTCVVDPAVRCAQPIKPACANFCNVFNNPTIENCNTTDDFTFASDVVIDPIDNTSTVSHYCKVESPLYDHCKLIDNSKYCPCPETTQQYQLLNTLTNRCKYAACAQFPSVGEDSCCTELLVDSQFPDEMLLPTFVTDLEDVCTAFAHRLDTCWSKPSNTAAGFETYQPDDYKADHHVYKTIENDGCCDVVCYEGNPDFGLGDDCVDLASRRAALVASIPAGTPQTVAVDYWMKVSARNTLSYQSIYNVCLPFVDCQHDLSSGACCDRFFGYLENPLLAPRCDCLDRPSAACCAEFKDTVGSLANHSDCHCLLAGDDMTTDCCISRGNANPNVFIQPVCECLRDPSYECCSHYLHRHQNDLAFSDPHLVAVCSTALAPKSDDLPANDVAEITAFCSEWGLFEPFHAICECITAVSPPDEPTYKQCCINSPTSGVCRIYQNQAQNCLNTFDCCDDNRDLFVFDEALQSTCRDLDVCQQDPLECCQFERGEDFYAFAYPTPTPPIDCASENKCRAEAQDGDYSECMNEKTPWTQALVNCHALAEAYFTQPSTVARDALSTQCATRFSQYPFYQRVAVCTAYEVTQACCLFDDNQPGCDFLQQIIDDQDLYKQLIEALKGDESIYSTEPAIQQVFADYTTACAEVPLDINSPYYTLCRVQSGIISLDICASSHADVLSIIDPQCVAYKQSISACSIQTTATCCSAASYPTEGQGDQPQLPAPLVDICACHTDPTFECCTTTTNPDNEDSPIASSCPGYNAQAAQCLLSTTTACCDIFVPVGTTAVSHIPEGLQHACECHRAPTAQCCTSTGGPIASQCREFLNDVEVCKAKPGNDCCQALVDHAPSLLNVCECQFNPSFACCTQVGPTVAIPESCGCLTSPTKDCCDAYGADKPVNINAVCTEYDFCHENPILCCDKPYYTSTFPDVFAAPCAALAHCDVLSESCCEQIAPYYTPATATALPLQSQCADVAACVADPDLTSCCKSYSHVDIIASTCGPYQECADSLSLECCQGVPQTVRDTNPSLQVCTAIEACVETPSFDNAACCDELGSIDDVAAVCSPIRTCTEHPHTTCCSSLEQRFAQNTQLEGVCTSLNSCHESPSTDQNGCCHVFVDDVELVAKCTMIETCTEMPTTECCSNYENDGSFENNAALKQRCGELEQCKESPVVDGCCTWFSDDEVQLACAPVRECNNHATKACCDENTSHFSANESLKTQCDSINTCFATPTIDDCCKTYEGDEAIDLKCAPIQACLDVPTAACCNDLAEFTEYNPSFDQICSSISECLDSPLLAGCCTDLAHVPEVHDTCTPIAQCQTMPTIECCGIYQDHPDVSDACSAMNSCLSQPKIDTETVQGCCSVFGYINDVASQCEAIEECLSSQSANCCDSMKELGYFNYNPAVNAKCATIEDCLAAPMVDGCCTSLDNIIEVHDLCTPIRQCADSPSITCCGEENYFGVNTQLENVCQQITQCVETPSITECCSTLTHIPDVSNVCQPLVQCAGLPTKQCCSDLDRHYHPDSQVNTDLYGSCSPLVACDAAPTEVCCAAHRDAINAFESTTLSTTCQNILQCANEPSIECCSQLRTVREYSATQFKDDIDGGDFTLVLNQGCDALEACHQAPALQCCVSHRGHPDLSTRCATPLTYGEITSISISHVDVSTFTAPYYVSAGTTLTVEWDFIGVLDSNAIIALVNTKNVISTTDTTQQQSPVIAILDTISLKAKTAKVTIPSLVPFTSDATLQIIYRSNERVQSSPLSVLHLQGDQSTFTLVPQCMKQSPSDQLQLVDSCTSFGKCNINTGACDCPQGTMGALCETNKCALTTCNPAGSSSGCNPSTGKCQCNQGWTGAYCEVKDSCQDPDEPCLHDGYYAFNANNDKCARECTCKGHFAGDTCDVCTNTCNLNGWPTEGCDTCACFSGFTGDSCQCQQRLVEVVLSATPALFNSEDDVSVHFFTTHLYELLAPTLVRVELPQDRLVVKSVAVTETNNFVFTLQLVDNCSANGAPSDIDAVVAAAQAIVDGFNTGDISSDILPLEDLTSAQVAPVVPCDGGVCPSNTASMYTCIVSVSIALVGAVAMLF